MDDQATIRTYGATELPAGTAERPLVTFAVFGYNQEKYIREAVDGALSQNYSPMEVVLSDDCSNDGTFEIMETIAKSYCGAKRLILRRSKKNQGTLLHVVEVSKLSRGGLLILAAGDDISKPHRTEALVEAWKNSNAWGFSSRFDRIDEVGNVICIEQGVELFASRDYGLRAYFKSYGEEAKIVHGATSAYDMRLFDLLETTHEDYILSEDGVLSIILNLLDKGIVALPDSLVLYRHSDQSLTNGSRSGRRGYADTVKQEEAIERFARSQANRCSLLLRLDKRFGALGRFSLDADHILNEREQHVVVCSWWRLGYIDKVGHLLSARTSRELKFFLPRMLPKTAFIWIKTLFQMVR